MRLYNQSLKGPLIVWINEINHQISPIVITLHINKTYKLTVSCVRKFGKRCRVQELWRCHTCKSCQSWFDVCDIVDMKDLIVHGMGCFNHVVLPNCKMLWAERLVTNKNRSNSHLVADNNLTYSNTVKIIFEGQVLLPHSVLFCGARIWIRPFHANPMFCLRCYITKLMDN